MKSLLTRHKSRRSIAGASSRIPMKKRPELTSFSPRKAAYIKKHFPDFSDGKLAKALDTDKKIIREYLAAAGLTRSPQQQAKTQGNEVVPPAYEAELPLPTGLYHFPKKYIPVTLAVFLIAFLVYCRTLAPTVTAEDSGELITAAYRLGIAHPPGYPLWCLLGKMFCTIIPAGNIAFRVNLMSAFWAAAAIALLFALMYKFTGSAAVSGGLALSFAFFADFWAQAVIAEVYSLNIFLIVLILLLAAMYYCNRDFRLTWALAFVSGLALGHHNTAAPVVFLSAVFLLYVSPKRMLKPRPLAISLILVLLGLSVYIYLPLRSAANPPMDWGNPETFTSVLDHIFRRQYAFGYTENPRSITAFLNQMAIFGKLAASQGTYIFLFSSLAGLTFLWQRDKYWLLLLVALMAAGGPALSLVINFELEREAIETVKPFFLPVYAAAAVLSAIFFADAIKLIPRFRGTNLLYAPVLFLALVPIRKNFTETDKSAYYYAYDYGKNLLASIDENGIIFSSSDYSTFPLIYLQSVEGIRNDVYIADKYGYIEQALYAEMPAEITSHFRKIPTPQERNIIERWILSSTPRPVFFTKKRDMQDLPDLELLPWGLTYKLVKTADAANVSRPNLWASYELRTLQDTGDYKDYSAHSILSDYYFARGRDYLYEGNSDKALEQFELVAREGWGVKEIYNNLGSICAENGLVENAIHYFRKALEIDPHYQLALQNLVKLSEHMGNYQKAIEYMKTLSEIYQDDPEALLHLALLYERAQDIDNAVETYHKVIRLAPEDFRPYRSLGYLLFSLPNARQDAVLMFSKSLERNPNQPDVEALLNKMWGNEFLPANR